MIHWLQGLFQLPHYKLLAFAIALSGWLYVQGSETVESKYRVGVAWKLPTGLVTTEPLPASVIVTLTGSRSAVRQTETADLMMAVDLTELGTGQADIDFSSFPLTGMPPNVSIVDHTPSSLRFFFDEADARKVKVLPELVGDPAEGYSVGTVTLEPAVIALEGPRSVVEKLREVSTKPIDVSTLVETTTVPVELAVPRSVHVVEGQDAVVASVEILPLVERKSFTGVPVVVPHHPEWRTSVPTVSVTLEGPSAALADLSVESLFATVMLPEEPDKARYDVPFGPGEGLRMEIRRPNASDVRVLSVEPPTVEVQRR